MNTPAARPLDLSTIPTLPQSLLRLIDACNDIDVDIHVIGSLVAQDAPLSARILQLANSAFLGTKAAFQEIEQAVIYLGIDTVRNLAISVSVHEAFRGEQPDSPINLPQFWYHSLLTAILAKNLAELTGYGRPAEAYLCGLLHDIGKLLLAAGYPKEYAGVLAAASSPDTAVTAERRHLGLGHTDAGAMLIRHWGLQEQVAAAIEQHHMEPQGGADEALPWLIHLANVLSQPRFTAGAPLPRVADARVKADELQNCFAESVSAVEVIAQALAIQVEKGTEPAADTRPKTDESARQELRDKARQLTVLHGALDNLLNAQDEERICQVMEETLVLLFGLRHAFIILPVTDQGRLRVAISSSNPLYPRCDSLPLPQRDEPSAIRQCLLRATVRHSGDTSVVVNPADQKIADFLESEGLLAVPVPLTGERRGALVVGIDQSRLQRTEELQESLRLLAAHVGSRLVLQQLENQRAAERLQFELAGIEKVTRAIAHEIANPLAIVQNYLVVLDRKIADGSETRQDLQLISKELGRISSVARQLEDISNLTSKPGRPAVNNMRLDHLLRETLAFFQESLFASNAIKVQIKLQPNTRVVEVPSETLHQVLAILFTNAAEALPGGGQLEISSSLATRPHPYNDRMLSLSVRDNGPGIPPEMLPAIFRAGISSKTEGHLGLGLSIARKLLLDLGGELDCSGSEASGACFTIRLPVA